VFEPNQEFDPLAATYNQCWGAEYHAEAFPVIEHLLLSSIAPGACLLDVCCGTGQFTKRVHDAGFSVTGVDASGEMLRYAHQNAPACSFYRADAREFSLGRKFAGAYSVFESLNHIPDLKGLTSAFQSIHRHPLLERYNRHCRGRSGLRTSFGIRCGFRSRTVRRYALRTERGLGAARFYPEANVPQS
jgi:SAM-dependent methyltransferase